MASLSLPTTTTTTTTAPSSSSSSSASSQPEAQPDQTTPKRMPATETMSSPTPYKLESMNPSELPRLVPRNLAHHQSKNKIRVNRKGEMRLNLVMRDWFHIFLRFPAHQSCTILLVGWTAIVLMFAGLYVGLDTMNSKLDCGLGDPGEPIRWGTAFAFSLETCTTVGYGLPGSTNAFFETQCPSVQIAIYAQMVWSMMFNAFLFAFFFTTLAKSEKRGAQVLFSDHAVIKLIKGKFMLTMQCYDLDSQYPLVESHVRFYALTKAMKMEPLRIMQPNDELGAMLYPSMPTQVTHHLDHHSILSPEKRPFVLDSNGLQLRAVDAATGGRDEIICPICGESYGSMERLRNHVRYNQMIEERENFPPELSHIGFSIPEIKPVTIAEIQQHLKDNISELIVVVEAIDPQVSGTFQAVHSYRFEDIIWDGEFASCLGVEDDCFVVDMESFHKVQGGTSFDQLVDQATAKVGDIEQQSVPVAKEEFIA